MKTSVSEGGHCYPFEEDFIFVSLCLFSVVPAWEMKLWWFGKAGAGTGIVSISTLGLSPGEMKRSFQQLLLWLLSDHLWLHVNLWGSSRVRLQQA